MVAAVMDNSNGQTKSFEAPHKRAKETFFTHVAGVTLRDFWRTTSWIMGHLPAGLVYRVGGAIAMLGYAASPTRRKWLRSNFGHVLDVSPDAPEAHRMARAAYRNYGRYLMELMRLPWLRPAQLENLVDVSTFARFVEIYNESNGVILVAAHLGNNEATAAGFSKHGLQINVVGDDSSYRELYEHFERQRESWGVKMISWRNLRMMYSALKRREALVLLVDWGYRADGIPVKMFGAWTALPAGPAILAAKYGSAIVPFSINRQPDGTFKLVSEEPIHVASSSPRDVAIAMQKIADALEAHISPAPEQWYIFKPIWPLTEAEAVQLEARHVAAMANDARRSAARVANGSPAHAGGAGTAVTAAADMAPPQPAEP
jgi:Kdo2-lipid IVA lauroyltransferase/acyltransferase